MEENINCYCLQLENLGFFFDWSWEVCISNFDYYWWIQWIFQQLFKYYFDQDVGKVKFIFDLVDCLVVFGNIGLNVVIEDDML